MTEEKKMKQVEQSSASSPLDNQSLTVQAKELQIKSCPQCVHLLKGGLKTNIHSTLAYSRCRCHRTWKFLSESPNMVTLTSRQLQHQPPRRNTSLEPLAHNQKASTGSVSQQVPANWTSGFCGGTKSLPTRKLTQFAKKTQISYTNDSSLPLTQIHTTGAYRMTHHSKQLTPLKEDSSPRHLPPPVLLPQIPTSTHQQMTSIPTLPQINNSTPSSSTHLLMSPASSRSKIEPSPKSSTNKLPQIKSTSMLTVSQCEIKQARGRSITHQPSPLMAKQVARAETKPQRRFELVQLLQHISPELRSKLDSLFTRLDDNGDGHLTYQEFLTGLPTEALEIQDYLKQFYNTLSDLTYFGKREFILAHCVMSSVLQSDIRTQVTEDTQQLGTLLNKLPPVMSQLCVHVSGKQGLATSHDVEDVIVRYNNTVQEHSRLRLNTARLAKVTSINLIDLLALATYYFKE